MKMRFSESLDAVPDGMLQVGFENKIMHASFTIGKMTIMASDGCDDKSKFEGFRLRYPFQLRKGSMSNAKSALSSSSNSCATRLSAVINFSVKSG